MALHAVQVIAARWLEARTKAPVDQPEDIERLRDYLGENPARFIPISEARSSLTTDILVYQDEAFFLLAACTFRDPDVGEGAGLCAAKRPFSGRASCEWR